MGKKNWTMAVALGVLGLSVMAGCKDDAKEAHK